MAWETRVQSQLELYQRLKNVYLITSCLTLIIIRYGSSVKWSNPREGVAPTLTRRCSSYWKGKLRDANFTLYIYIYIYIYIYYGLVGFNVLDPNNSRQNSYLCLTWHFKSATDLHANTLIISYRKFIRWRSWYNFCLLPLYFEMWRLWLSKFLMTLQHSALKRVRTKAICSNVSTGIS